MVSIIWIIIAVHRRGPRLFRPSERFLSSAARPITVLYVTFPLASRAAAAYQDAFTLIDLPSLRPLVFGPGHKALDADLLRTIHGFDSLMVLTGSMA